MASAEGIIVRVRRYHLGRAVVDCRVITTLCSLVYLIPDTRSTPNHEKIVFFDPEYNLRVPSKEIPVPQPQIVVKGSLQDSKEAFLVVDKMCLCKLKFENIPLALMAGFYAFNVRYTPFLESYFLSVKLPKMTRLGNFVAMLESIVV